MNAIKEEIFTVQNCVVLIKKGHYRLSWAQFHRDGYVTAHLIRRSDLLWYLPERIKTGKISRSTYEKKLSSLYY